METFSWTRSLLIGKNLCILRCTISKPYIGENSRGQLADYRFLGRRIQSRHSHRCTTNAAASQYCRVLLDRIFFKNEIFLWTFFRNHRAHRILRGRKRTHTRENIKFVHWIAIFLWSQNSKFTYRTFGTRSENDLWNQYTPIMAFAWTVIELLYHHLLEKVNNV